MSNTVYAWQYPTYANKKILWHLCIYQIPVEIYTYHGKHQTTLKLFSIEGLYLDSKTFVRFPDIMQFLCEYPSSFFESSLFKLADET